MSETHGSSGTYLHQRLESGGLAQLSKGLLCDIDHTIRRCVAAVGNRGSACARIVHVNVSCAIVSVVAGRASAVAGRLDASNTLR